MLDQLFDLLRQNGQESVINNPDVPNEHNEGVLQEAQSSIVNVLKGITVQGQSDQAVSMNDDAAQPALQQMQHGFIQQIGQKFGINGDAAKNIAGSLIPMVLSQLQNKQAEGGGINLSGIMGMLSKAGLDKDGDGDVDLRDVTKMFGL